MTPATDATFSRLDVQAVHQSVRTAVAAVVSWLVARSLTFPEAYWAVATALIVMQSVQEATLAVSMQRLAGTALGAVVGAVLVEFDVTRAVALPLGVLGLGLLCAALRLGKPANRFAGIALVIVTLTPRVQPPFTTALHRFFEVAIGIGVALIALSCGPNRTQSGTS
jgi:uncharacterized membrane protein YccC